MMLLIRTTSRFPYSHSLPSASISLLSLSIRGQKEWKPQLQNDFGLFPRHNIQYYSNPSPCLIHKWERNWVLMVLWRSSRPSRTNTKKICPLIHQRELKCKSRKCRHIWNNRQAWHLSTKWSKSKANRVLQRECTGQSKHPLPTT